MIGGMRTIMNGAFEIDTGDMIQWYWSAETNCFDTNGRRHDPLDTIRSQDVNAFLAGHGRDLSRDSLKRKAVQERGNGVFSGSMPDGNVTYNGKTEVAFPKSIRPRKDGVIVIGDKMRVFARAMSGGRPFEMVDVLIMRQSM
jgi:hypothetical protein